MVKSECCNLAGLSPKQLIQHHEEAEVSFNAFAAKIVCSFAYNPISH